jgi:hypothetical protein
MPGDWVITSQDKFDYDLELLKLKQQAINNRAYPSLPTIGATFGHGVIMTVRTDKSKMDDHYVMGIEPEVGEKYNWYCVEKKIENGQVVAKFRLG